mmetsp:Transcript_71841/g.119559  ORF Transcript_71841/g.119559 Transcript_71841/m.119559 type:complete len:359 (-) Transcript_71841:92-1168(-)
MKIVMIILACSELSAVRADRSVDDTSIVAMLKVMQEQMQEQMAKLEDRIMAKDETIASLTAALQSKTEHRQVQLTAGGEVMQLVSEADFKELATRVAACEKTNADQDAKLGMTMDTLTKVRKEVKDGRVGAPPALPPSLPPPLPPPRPVKNPRRHLSSSSNGTFVNELSITGSNAVVSWNSHTPGLSSFNCTGVGDGRLTCSGEINAENFVTRHSSLEYVAGSIDQLNTSIMAIPVLFDQLKHSLRMFEYLGCICSHDGHLSYGHGTYTGIFTTSGLAERAVSMNKMYISVAEEVSNQGAYHTVVYDETPTGTWCSDTRCLNTCENPTSTGPIHCGFKVSDADVGFAIYRAWEVYSPS